MNKVFVISVSCLVALFFVNVVFSQGANLNPQLPTGILFPHFPKNKNHFIECKPFSLQESK